MIIEWLLFVGAAIGTFVLGTPIAVALAGQHRWVHPAARDASSRRQRTDVVRAYAPLDLGPDPIRWPSERLWDLKSTLAVPDWPSKSWNDEHFGRQHKDTVAHDASEQGFHAMAARRHREESSAGAPPKPRSQPSANPARRERTATKGRPRQAAEPAPVPAPAPTPAPQPAARKAAPVVPVTPPSRTRPPDEAEIEHLIASVGLAGTVQAIMQRTGWEFREAAQYLARIRKT